VVLLGAVLLAPHGPSGPSGAGHWLFGLDHFGALVLIGLWAGRRPAPAVWLVPSSLLVGAVLGVLMGSLLALPISDPTIDRLFFPLMLVTTGALAVLALLVYLFSPFNVTRALTLVAMAHGYADSSGMGTIDPAAFVLAYAAAGALLLALGVIVGREVPRNN
jgi:hydrogenase/urease accessory protein HupE